MYKSPFFSLSLNDAVGGVKFRTAPPSLNPMEKLKVRLKKNEGRKIKAEYEKLFMEKALDFEAPEN